MYCVISVGRKATSIIPDRNMLNAAPPYSLQRTLSCGQSFRWNLNGHEAQGVFEGRLVKLRQSAEGIAVNGLRSEGQVERLRLFLGVDQPLAEIEDRLRSDRVLRHILPHTSGIAILRQDPWECLVSFIVSAFNNIPKIELTLEKLAQRFGTPVGRGAWRFPAPGRLAEARVAELRTCALGYRALYIRKVARLVDSRTFGLSAPAGMPYEHAKRLLLSLPGVGDKVADCVLLFAYGKIEAFPVDVWVKRAVERLYFRDRQKTERYIRVWAQEQFGSLAGYAQQHLFYYIREQGTGNGERRKIRSERTSASLGSGRRRRR